MANDRAEEAVGSAIATAAAPGRSVPSDQAALSIRDLQKTFQGMARPVFSGVTFDVPRGQRVALIGANGTGKSTLLRSCLRLVHPDHGRVWFEGTELTCLRGRALRAVRAKVGFIFQRHNLVPRLTALTNVIHGSIARGYGIRAWRQSFAPAAERELAMHCLERVGLPELADRPCRNLSGGQSQRVAIARALMQKPRAIFADEPVASLDPAAAEGVMELFASLSRQEGLTLVFVSHDLEHAVHYSDRILGLRGGGLELDTTSEEAAGMDLRGFYD